MLPLKLLRSLVLGETINNPLLVNPNLRDHSDDDVDVQNHEIPTHRRQRSNSRRRESSTINGGNKTKTPLLIFLPTREVVRDTYRLATIARDMGMDLYPSPSLSHVIFSWPSSGSSSSSSSSSSSPSIPSLWSSSSSSWPFSGDAIPLPFPSLTTASTAQLRSFVGLSKGLFKLAFCSFNSNSNAEVDSTSHWDCSSLSLYSRLSGDRIDSMDGFCKAITGMGWTLFKTKNKPSLVSGDGIFSGVKSVYLFRKIDSNKFRASQSNGGGEPLPGEFRIRELRLPSLDFRNAPLRILQYIILMTDDLFYLA